jgi:hypothetical protein
VFDGTAVSEGGVKSVDTGSGAELVVVIISVVGGGVSNLVVRKKLRRELISLLTRAE